jgi:membrane associated rhomboid family serine protease
MASYYRGPSSGSSVTIQFPPVTPMVRKLLWTIGICFAVQTMLESVLRLGAPVRLFELSPIAISERFFLWQLLTYGFLHAGLWHLLSNMLGLWMFGGEVERVLGSKRLLRFVLICVAGGGLTYLLVGWLTENQAPVVGISAGVLGLLVAFAIFDPDRMMYLFPLPFPIRARTIAIGYALLDLYSAVMANADRSSMTGSDGRLTAFSAHLGGMAVAFVYIQLFVRGRGLRWRWPWRRSRPFKVIHGRRNDPFDLH